MMLKSATVQAAVSSGGKIGQNPPPPQDKQKERHKISSPFGTDNQGSYVEPWIESGGKKYSR